MCSSKNIHTPTEGTFVLTPPPGISISRGAYHIPPALGISVIFLFGWIPPEKNLFLKNAVALSLYAIVVSVVKRKKNCLFMLILCQKSHYCLVVVFFTFLLTVSH